MNPFALLETDHKKLKTMLSELDETSRRAGKTREQLFEKIKIELTAHEAIEEEILYPAIKAAMTDKALVLEAYQEHHVADLIVAELSSLPTTDEDWGAKATVLKENIEHHIKEEEGDLFKAARSALDRDELETIGDKMAARKKELLGKEAAA